METHRAGEDICWKSKLLITLPSYQLTRVHIGQFSADAGEWVNQNLPIAADTLADILDNAKKHAEHVRNGFYKPIKPQKILLINTFCCPGLDSVDFQRSSG